MDISKYWKTVADNLQDALLVVDPGGNIIAVNKAARDMTGYSEDEIIGLSCKNLNCTGCRIIGRGTGPDWCPIFTKGHMKGKRCTILHKTGRSVNVLKTATVLKDDEGNLIGAVEILTDITESVRKEEEIVNLRHLAYLDKGFHGFIGRSSKMENLFEMIRQVAEYETPVMIRGQSGTGKELAARAIHEISPRRDKPYIKVNCAAFNEGLLESELFGHIKGAFTGAEKNRIGRFEAAHGGTIFLDEIGDLPLDIQVKLLRVLEDRKIERVGENTPVHVDVRIITATHKNLEALIEQGLFREDLYFRINVFPVSCPSLTERPDDIPALSEHFLKINTDKTGKKLRGISSSAMAILMAWSWPGNVRELRNVIEYAFILCPGDLIEPSHLPSRLLSGSRSSSRSEMGIEIMNDQRSVLMDALKKAGGNQTLAARILGVSRITVWKKMKALGIDSGDIKCSKG